jgi:hypothetical protein
VYTDFGTPPQVDGDVKESLQTESPGTDSMRGISVKPNFTKARKYVLLSLFSLGLFIDV